MERRLTSAVRSNRVLGRTNRSPVLKLTTLVLLIVALTASGCSKSDGSSPTSSEKTETTDGTGSQASMPENTLPDEEFFANVDAAKKAIADAGSDPCKLAPTLGAGVAAPANKEQAKALVELYEAIFKGVAGVLGAETEGGRAALELNERMHEMAEANDFEPQFMVSAEFEELFSSAEFEQAGTAFENMTVDCTDDESDVNDPTDAGDAPDADGADSSDTP